MPDCRVEVLIPDFQGLEEPLRIVMDARPDILNHNTETVPRLYRVARSGARYERTLRLLERAKEMNPAIPTKTGVMVGLGETTDELLAVFRDLAARNVDILTIGQYLRPSKDHLPVARLYTPGRIPHTEGGVAKDGIQARGVRSAGALQLSRARAGRRRHGLRGSCECSSLPERIPIRTSNQIGRLCSCQLTLRLYCIQTVCSKIHTLG